MSLRKLIEKAADDMWGTCSLTHDGDCFTEYSWHCKLTWVFSNSVGGHGHTPEEAIADAMKKKAKEKKKNRPGPGARWATKKDIKAVIWDK